ncbi:TonB-dependent receptor [Lutibacter sp. B1]|nr:TonB-dependent receptor [Lutibacter sp. B1]
MYDQNGLTLPGVNIIEKGTSNGVVTDFDGNYTISVQNNATLVFSYVGFDTQEVKVSGRTTVNVTLKENLESLEEVVVIGYGTQLKENMSGSVSSIKSEQLQNIPQVSVDQLMQGRAAGVSITTDSGQPGSAVSVRVRGVTSIAGSNEPLYVIDGIQVSGDVRNLSTSGRTAAGGEGQNGVSPLAALNPNDIESINILKDASATAIYGSRGANGVVIITTKKGKQGRGKLTYNTYVALQQATNLINMMDLPAYAVLQNDLSPLYQPTTRDEFVHPELLGPGTDWQDEVFRDAFMQNHVLSFSGANEKVDYYISTGYLDQEGTVIGSDFNRISIKANVNGQVNDWLKVGTSVTLSRTKENITLNGRRNGIVSLGLLQAPDVAVYNADGTFAYPSNDNNQGAPNPIAIALSNTNNLTRDRILGNVYAELKVTDNLTYRTEIGGDFGYNTNKRFQPTTDMGRFSNLTAVLNLDKSDNEFWVIKNLLTYNNTFADKHNVTLLLGHEAQESTWSGVQNQGSGFVSNDIQSLALADQITVDDYGDSAALISYFGRLIYNFDGKYGLTASIRADGSSKFDPDGDNQWGYFPSVSASWNVSKEPFMTDFNAVRNIKLKAGYGVVGNQDIPNYRYGASLSSYVTDLGIGFAVSNIPNSDLQWEESQQVNVGLDFSLFNDRLNTTVEWYSKTSEKFLYPLALPTYLVGGESWEGGVGAPYVNLGKMRNTGVDVSLNYSTIGNGDFSWNSTLTFSRYKNEVKELLEGLDIFGETNVDDLGTAVTTTQVGQALGLYYGYKVDGIFRTVEDIQNAPVQFGVPFDSEAVTGVWLGDIKYKDVNGDGVVNEGDLTVIGNPHPDFTFGFNNSFNYKNLELSIFMQGSYGNDLMNLTRRETSSLNRLYTNNLMSVADYWTPENNLSSTPRLRTQEHQNNKVSDRWIEDGSYLRIQNITLGYNFPSDVLEKINISRLKVYGSVQNLYTFTEYSGYDPEVGSFNQDALLMGVDNGRYPTPRTFTLGLNVEF